MDCGIMMLARVIPAMTSPNRLPERFRTAIRSAFRSSHAYVVIE